MDTEIRAAVILCDYAQVHAGKLNIVGGAVDLAGTSTTTAPYDINLAAGVLVTVPWNSHNRGHRLKISLVNEDGEIVAIAQPAPGAQIPEEDRKSLVADFNVGKPPTMQPGDESVIPIAVPLNIKVPILGGYCVTAEIDGREVARAKFRVVRVAQAVAA